MHLAMSQNGIIRSVGVGLAHEINTPVQFLTDVLFLEDSSEELLKLITDLPSQSLPDDCDLAYLQEFPLHWIEWTAACNESLSWCDQ